MGETGGREGLGTEALVDVAEGGFSGRCEGGGEVEESHIGLSGSSGERKRSEKNRVRTDGQGNCSQHRDAIIEGKGSMKGKWLQAPL